MGVVKLARRVLLPTGGGSVVETYISRIAGLKRRGHLRRAKLLSARLSERHGVYISALAEVPETTTLPHPTGIVIGDGVKLADHVTIYQNVTLGGARRGDGDAGKYPTIGEGTVIFAGAVLIGAITVGPRCVIGANSVVTTDLPPDTTAVGAPARAIKRRASDD